MTALTSALASFTHWYAAQQPAPSSWSLDRFMHPALLIPCVALSIPILLVLLSGLKGLVRAMRGEPDDFEHWKSELQELRGRVDALERSVHAGETNH